MGILFCVARNILFFYSFSSIYCAISTDYLYKPYERDMVMLIDWYSESPVKKLNALTTKSPIGAVTIGFLTNLYSPSVPLLLSASLWHNVLNYAQLAYDLRDLSAQDIKKKYYDDSPENTKLNSFKDEKYIKKLQKITKKLFEIYHDINDDLTRFSYLSDPKAYVQSLSKYNDQTLGGVLLDQQDKDLWQYYANLLVYVVAVEKVKAENEWIMKKVSDEVFLFIPRTYLINVEKATLAFRDSNLADLKTRITALEQEIPRQDELIKELKKNLIEAQESGPPSKQEILGLNYQTLSDIQDAFQGSINYFVATKTLEDYSDQFIKVLKNLFSSSATLPIATLRRVKNIKGTVKIEPDKNSWLPWDPSFCRWNFYGAGHGSRTVQNQSAFLIMGLSNASFKDLLIFLSTIRTNFFLYVSCYAGGQRLENIYVNEDKSLHYMFTIAVGALTDAPAGVHLNFTLLPLDMRGELDQKMKKLIPNFTQNFAQFFSGLHMGESYIMEDSKKRYLSRPTLKEIINTAHPFYDPITNKLTSFANVPQIRFPGSAWFDVVDLDTLALHITPTFAAVREAEKRPIKTKGRMQKGLIQTDQRKKYEKRFVDVEYQFIIIDALYSWEFVKKHLENSLLRVLTAQINVPLIIDKNMPTIICSAAGDASLYLQEVQAPLIGLRTLLKGFFGVTKSVWSRTYYIKELEVLNDLSDKNRRLIGAYKRSIVFKDVVLFVNSSRPKQPDQISYGFVGKINGKCVQLLFDWSKLVLFDWLKLAQWLEKPLELVECSNLTIPEYPYYIRGQLQRDLSSRNQQIVNTDQLYKKRFDELEPWFAQLSLADQAYFKHYNYFIKEPAYAEFSGTPNQKLASMFVSKVYSPVEVATFKSSLSQEDLKFIEDFEKVYTLFEEFKRWRGSLTQKDYDYLISYRAAEQKTSYTPIVSLLRRTKLLQEQYKKVAQDPVALEQWLSVLQGTNRKFVERFLLKNKKLYLVDLLADLDQTLKGLRQLIIV